MKIHKTISLTLLSLLYSYTVSGFVKDDSNGEPLPYTNIIIYIDNNLENESDYAKGAASYVNG